MKKYLLIITILFLSIQISKSDWEVCSNGLMFNNGSYINVMIANANYLFAGTKNGGIFVSTDYGSNWTQKNNGLTDTTITYFAKKGNNIYAVTKSKGLFLTTDNGENWTQTSKRFLDTTINAIGIDSIKTNNMFLGTDNGFYLSTDNGASWTQKYLGYTSTHIYSIAVNKEFIFAGIGISSGYTYLLLSSDNGNSWFNEYAAYNNIIINDSNVYCSGGSSIYRSSDFGINWTYGYLNSSSGYSLTTINAVNLYNNIFTTDYYNTDFHAIYMTTNFGINWTKINNATYTIYTLAIKGEYLFGGTYGQGIYRYKLSDLGITSVKETLQDNSIQIYPNPVNDILTVKTNNPQRIEIYNLLGIKVIETNEHDINIQALSKGIYYLRTNNIQKMFIKD